jgi:Transposase DDE domain
MSIRGARSSPSVHVTRGIGESHALVDEAILEEMSKRVKENPAKMKKRKELAEHPYGTMKRAMNSGYFLMRGIKKVGAEMSLTILGYNADFHGAKPCNNFDVILSFLPGKSHDLPWKCYLIFLPIGVLTKWLFSAMRWRLAPSLPC